jgi:hypothetical protein
MGLYFFYFLIGHLVGDFLLQTGTIAKNKSKNIFYLLLHIFLVFLATALLFLPYLKFKIVWIALFVNAFIHFFIDFAKIKLEKKFKNKILAFFCLDQILHLVVILFLSYFLSWYKFVDLWFTDLWWFEFYQAERFLFYIVGFLIFSYMADIFLWINEIQKKEFRYYFRDYQNMIERTFLFAILFLIFFIFYLIIF